MPNKTVHVESQMGRGYAITLRAGAHTMHIDQPKGVGGTDTGPSPLDYCLMSLAGCISTIARIIAEQRRMELRGITVTVDGDINTDFLLGKTKEGRAGFTGIRVQVGIDADMTQEQKEAFLHEVDERCPISDNLLRTTSISFTVR